MMGSEKLSGKELPKVVLVWQEGNEWKLTPERLVQALGHLGDGCYTGTRIEQFSCV